MSSVIRYLVVPLLVLSCTACGGPEAKKAKFLAKGKALYEKGEYGKAALEFKNAAQIDPKFAEAYRMLGLAALKQGNLKGGYGSFLKATELNPGDLKSQFQLGQLLVAARQGEKAMAKAELILAKDPKNQDGLLLKGAVYVLQKNPAVAIPYFEGLIKSGIAKPDAYQLLATSYLLKNDGRAAESVLASGAAANPKAVTLLTALAAVQVQRGALAEAAEVMKKIVAMEPNETRHTLRLAEMYWKMGQRAQGEALLKGVVAAAPEKDERRLQVTAFYLANGLVQEAEQELNEGIRSIPKSAPLRFALADLLVRTGRADKAESLLKEILAERGSSAPDQVKARLTLAKLAMQGSDGRSKALGYLEEVIKESPRNVVAHLLKGTILLLNKEGGKAVSEFRTVVSEEPQSVPGQLGLADAHLVNREPALALEVLKTANKNLPESRDILRALSRVYEMQNDPKTAREILTGIVTRHPGDLEVVSDLGDFYLRHGEPKKAEVQYAEVKRKAPKLAVGYVKCSELYVREGKLDRARAELEQARRLDPRSWRIANDLAFLKGEGARSRQELAGALALAEEALGMNPNELTVQDTAGWLNFRNGNNGRALELLAKVQKGAPNSPLVNFHLGMAQYKAGQGGAAKELLKRALAAGNFPGYEEAERTLRTL